ncbi:hypothetical protein B296_00001971 [Ensete ventricosum]|uniref:Uncharacterized protein n=1 Tax=Ensete ventricosum TaxID=4639 RepID=A0A427B9H5_ENSVE|nr:hypothetical protein B296_00001971 [Ensete ventricosum]
MASIGSFEVGTFTMLRFVGVSDRLLLNSLKSSCNLLSMLALKASNFASIASSVAILAEEEDGHGAGRGGVRKRAVVVATIVTIGVRHRRAWLEVTSNKWGGSKATTGRGRRGQRFEAMRGWSAVAYEGHQRSWLAEEEEDSGWEQRGGGRDGR